MENDRLLLLASLVKQLDDELGCTIPSWSFKFGTTEDQIVEEKISVIQGILDNEGIPGTIIEQLEED